MSNILVKLLLTFFNFISNSNGHKFIGITPHQFGIKTDFFMFMCVTEGEGEIEKKSTFLWQIGEEKKLNSFDIK
jgi:hypothetical protein